MLACILELSHSKATSAGYQGVKICILTACRSCLGQAKVILPRQCFQLLGQAAFWPDAATCLIGSANHQLLCCAVKWHMESLLILTIYTAMLVVNIIYFAFRFRYTLKTAVNPQDRSSTARYRVSAYPVICIIVEIL